MLVEQQDADEIVSWIVYVHINKINGKKYVGITSREPEKRWQANGHGYYAQPKFYNAIKKYGWDNFEHEIVATGLAADEASIMEHSLVKEYDSYNNGYNASEGGELHYGVTTPEVLTNVY